MILEVLAIVAVAIAIVISIVVVGLLAVAAYFVLYSLYCLVFNKPNKLDLNQKLFDSEDGEQK